jgi:hypothetical protein
LAGWAVSLVFCFASPAERVPTITCAGSFAFDRTCLPCPCGCCFWSSFWPC